MAQAKDFMTPDPIILESSATITEAVEVFASHKINSAPVRTSQGEYAGTLTDLTLVRILVLHQLQPEKYKKLAHRLDFLEPLVFVEQNQPVAEVLKAMLRAPSHRVFVRAKNNHICGVISPKDLLRVLTTDSYEANTIKHEIKKMDESK